MGVVSGCGVGDGSQVSLSYTSFRITSHTHLNGHKTLD